MKKVLFLLLACLATVFAGTAIKKSGVKTYNNYNAYLQWDFDTSGTFTRTGAAAGTNTDSLILLQDSASTIPFYTSAFTIKGIQPGVPDAFADSIKYCVLAHDDALDAITLRTEYQVKFNPRATTWTTVGGSGDIALAGGGVPVVSCITRQFFPGLPFRLALFPSTTTDSAQVNWVDAFTVRK